jgi:hypothetical protein
MSANDKEFRKQLVALLRGGQAYMTFDHAVADFPMAQINAHPTNVPYTFWHLLEHLRIAQRDILDYIHGTDYRELAWPKEYWPAPDTQATPEQWEQTIRQFHEDRRALQAIVENAATDLTAPLPHAPQHNILRQILVVADHNAYHTGELGILRQVMHLW